MSAKGPNVPVMTKAQVESLLSAPQTKVVGKGVYGAVSLANHPKLGPLALKVFHNVNNNNENDESNKVEEENAHIRVWKRLGTRSSYCQRYIAEPIRSKHPAVGVQRSAIPRGHEGMDLDKYLKKIRKNSPTKSVHPDLQRKLVLEMMQAMKCLHDHGIAHGDIKLDNFMVHYPTGKYNYSDVRVKLIDLGLALFAGNNKRPRPLVGVTNSGNFNNSALREHFDNMSPSNQVASNYLGRFSNLSYMHLLPIGTMYNTTKEQSKARMERKLEEQNKINWGAARVSPRIRREYAQRKRDDFMKKYQELSINGPVTRSELAKYFLERYLGGVEKTREQYLDLLKQERTAAEKMQRIRREYAQRRMQKAATKNQTSATRKRSSLSASSHSKRARKT